jgi:hypothetical protein
VGYDAEVTPRGVKITRLVAGEAPEKPA